MNKRKKLIIGFIFIIGLIVYLLIIVINQQQLLAARQNELKIMEQKVAQQIRINEELKESLNILGSDEYIEKVAREKLGMLKADEKVFVDINK